MESNRQIVVAMYKTFVPFVVPKGVDLNAPGVKWGIKWNELYIEMPDGTEHTIEAAFEAENDMKRPDETSIESEKGWEHLIEEEEEEEEEKEK